MLKKILISILFILGLCIISCNDNNEIETSDTTNTYDTIYDTIENDTYTVQTIEFPTIVEDIYEPQGDIILDKHYNITFDNQIAKLIKIEVQVPSSNSSESSNVCVVPALALFDPKSNTVKKIIFTCKDPDTLTWVVDTSFDDFFKFKSSPQGEFVAIVMLYSREQDTAINNSNMTLDELENFIRNQPKTEITYRLNSWDSEGRLKFSVPVDDILPNINSINSFEISTNGNIYFYYDEYIIVISAEGEKLYTIELPNEYISPYTVNGLPKLTHDEDGNVVFCVYKKKTANDKLGDAQKILIDDITKSLSSEAETYFNVTTQPYFGKGYVCYYEAIEGFMAIDDNNNSVKLFTWYDTEIDFSSIGQISVVSSNDIIIATANPLTFYLITNEAAETDERQAIRLAYDENGSGVKMSDIVSCIQDFNSTNEDYRIDFVPYSSDATGKSASEKLVNDILTGNAPDLILFGSSITPETFVKIDALADLYPLMEAGGRYTKSDFIPCVLEPFENSKGELPYMTTDYYIATMVGKSS
ncbi:MAG: hypothetical protein IJ493_06530, partial [Clostridia bacterium]|nr:hypothetical protein [Clostridia bacterium]